MSIKNLNAKKIDSFKGLNHLIDEQGVYMKLALIFLIGMTTFAANAEVLKAVGFSEQRMIAVGLKSSAIKDAKERLVTECLKQHAEDTCADMKFEVNMTKIITHRQCGGTISGPEGRCSYAEAEVWGKL